MNKKVAVLMGGISNEREVSLNSGKACLNALIEYGYDATAVDITTDDFDTIKSQLNGYDVAFNALHGIFGEDGGIQSILNKLNIPYTHSGYETSKLAMDKPATIELYKKNDIPVADNIILSPAEFSYDKIPFDKPYVIKPAREGSSVGLYIIFDDTDLPDLSNWDFGDIMVEKYVAGLELTVSVIDDKALNVTELKPLSGIYDYDSKYVDGKTEHICPAQIDESLKQQLFDIAIKCHKSLKCRGISRTDFRFDPENNILATLETNTQPGMTDLSLVPEQAKSIGIDLPNLVNILIENAKID
ncbi:MAG: D-alanine--D-alanine ligase [Alphaproteobacteria bacterium]